MPLCCWPWKGSRKCGSLAKDSPVPSPEKQPIKPPEIKVSEAPEYGNGNPRNKCALQPGHSLMDWIRFGNSGIDLTGTGGKQRCITPAELATHDQLDNAWIAIRGKVYNIVHYLDYHPGGPDELMRGAGKDATQLFDQIHAWVNYESLLSKCLIGPLKQTQISEEEFKKLFESSQNSPKTKQTDLLRKSAESLKTLNASQTDNSKNISLKSQSDSEFTGNKSSSESSLNINETKSSASQDDSKYSSISKQETSKTISSISRFKYPTLTLTKADSLKSDSEAVIDDSRNTDNIGTKQILPKFDWIQKMDSVTLIFYSKALCNPHIEISCVENNNFLHILLIYDSYCYTFEVTLEDRILWPCITCINHDTGKVEITFKKETPKIWKSYGNIDKTNIKEHIMQIDNNNNECVVVDKWEVTHNTVVLMLRLKSEKHIIFPIGYHCRVFCDTEDSLFRSYTPIPPYLVSEFKPAKWSSNCLCLMVKKYDRGAVSTWLTSKNVNNNIPISIPLGNFSLKVLQDVSLLCLIAAGTGITPMLSIIQFALQRRNPRCSKIDLLFFNRSEKDILWNNQLSMLVTKDERFHLTNILSESSHSWNGLKGHINQALLKNCFIKIYLGEADVSMDKNVNTTEKSIADVEHFISINQNLFFCICGPSSFTQLSKTLLIGLGCNEERIHCFLG